MRFQFVMLVAVYGSGCSVDDGPGIECSSSALCAAAPGGSCLMAESGRNWCVYDDAACPSGRRYSSEAGDGLGAMCLPESLTFTVSVGLAGQAVGSVVSSPEGIDCGATCSARLVAGTRVTLSASTPAQSTFLGWSGNVSGCGITPTCTFVVDRDLTIQATYGATGSALWLNRAGGSNAEKTRTLAVGADGSVYVAGVFAETFSVEGKQLTYHGGSPNWDVFLIKFGGTDGHVEWARSIGSTTLDDVYALAVDPDSGDVLVGGSYKGALDVGAPQPLAVDGTEDYFLARYAKIDGSHVWSRTLKVGGVAKLAFKAVPGGMIYLGGNFYQNIDFGSGPVATKGSIDLFVAQLATSNGAVQWSATYGAAGGAAILPAAIVRDSSGFLVVAGSFYGTTSFGGGKTLTEVGGGDVFLVKVNGTNGAYVWSFQRGGASGDFAYDLVASTDDSFILAAKSYAGDQGGQQIPMDYGGGALPGADSGEEVIVAKYSTLGVHQWSRRFGGPGNQSVGGIGISPSGDKLVIGGSFENSMEFDNRSLSKNGRMDAYAAVLRLSDGETLWADRFGGTDYTSVEAVATDPTGLRVIAAGTFEGFTQFSSRSAMAAGLTDCFAATIVPQY